jgi:succinyl-diaminopimelate desuccinylase
LWIPTFLVAVILAGWCATMIASSQKRDPKDLISEDRIVRLLQQMIRIDSQFAKGVVHNHKEMVAFLEKELRSIGVEVEVVRPTEPFEAPYHRGLGVKYPGDPADFPVVVARLRGRVGKPVLGLETLYNNVVIGDRSQWTVDPLGGEIKDGKVYGRGATNSHASVAKYIEVLRVLKESGMSLDGDLVVTLTPGEGATEFAMPWVVAHRPELVKADWYLMGCCGPVFQKQAGHIWAKLTVLGTMHHPGSADVNAVHQMIQVLPKVIDVDSWMKWTPDPVFSKPHVEATVLSSGNPREVAVNVMPAKVEAHLDIRLLPNQEPKQVVVEINKLLDDLKKADPKLEVQFEVAGVQKVPEEYWSRITEKDRLVQEILKMSRDYTGKDVKMSWRGGVGGGRPDFWNLGALVVFSGGLDLPRGGGGAHSPDEYANINALVPGTRVIVDIVQRVLAKASASGQ